MNSHFTKHALRKFDVLQQHNAPLTREQVLDALTTPDHIDDSRQPLLIAHKAVAPGYAIRVAYKEESGIKIVITFYPGRKPT